MVPAAKRLIFRKDVVTLLGWLKQVVLARFEPVVTRFGPRKILKRLQKGPFWDQKWVKMGRKCVFPKAIVDRLGCTKK